MIPLLKPFWHQTTELLSRTVRTLFRTPRQSRVAYALVAATLMGASSLSSAGYSTGGGTGSGTPGTPALLLTNTAINPTRTDAALSATNPPTASFSVTSPAMTAYLGYRLNLTNNSTLLSIGGSITLTYRVSSLNSAPLPLPTNDLLVLPAGWSQGGACTTQSATGGAYVTGGPYLRTCVININNSVTPGNAISPNETETVSIFLRSPLYSTSSTATQCPTTTIAASGQCVRLAASVTATYTSGSTVTSNGANEEILLGTTASNRAIRAHTAVPPAGATLFTGYDAATTTGQFSSAVNVPSSAGTFVTSARILESTITCNTTTAFKSCSRADITVPAPGSVVPSFYPQYLQIQLRINSNQIKSPSSVNLGLVTLYYVPNGSTSATTIPNCSSTTTPASVGSGPCIASRTFASDSDYIFNLISYTNGGYYFK